MGKRDTVYRGKEAACCAGGVRKATRKESARYHEAAFAAFVYMLRKHRKNGDVTLEDERQLSKRPLRVDIIIIKKNRNAEIENSWARIFRSHNILEYKSPVDSPPDMAVFDKVVHGYAGIYAAQENVPLTEMSATIVCFKKPTELFKALKADFNYKILRKDKGVYYIINKGCPPEKALAVQVVVTSELDASELPLMALRPDLDPETLQRIEELPVEDEEYQVSLEPWFMVLLSENEYILTVEDFMKKRYDDYADVYEVFAKKGLLEKYEQKGRLEGRQEGRQEGRLEERRNILEFLKNGHTLEEAEKEFALT
ncbi:MAG: hypothetical protein FWB85_09980 [Chitinispirillia bacterium]|nr:hypothetical protein [Chitinispirillia bacterium]MCL2242526.1 hypothetical protein [Chitinispirillia bacterium]